MRKKLIPEKEITALTRKVVKCFYDRNPADAVEYLADNFVWIGAFDFQFAKSKKEFLEIIKSELNAPTFNMVDEEFFSVHRSSTCYVVCGKFKLYGSADGENYITTHTRLTVVWRYKGDELKLVHVQGSNAQDIPLSVSVEKQNTDVKQNDDFFNYLNSLHKSSIPNKLSFRDKTGVYRYFLENEILYLEANAQTCFIHTKDDCIEISGLLADNVKKLPDSFYRIHKTYVVNTNFVNSLKRYRVTLLGGMEVPISKDKYIPFREFNKGKF